MVLPALAHRQTIFRNHLQVLGGPDGLRHPGVGPARLEGNPVHEEMVEAAEMARPGFLLNTVFSGGRVQEVFAGDWREAHRAGCEQARRRSVVPIRGKRWLVVVGAGGHPADINAIQAHKAMEHASYALEGRGVMILLARCPDGLGHPDFFPWFAWRADLPAMASRLRADYQVYGQTALSWSVKASRFRVALLSELPPDTVEAMGLRPMASLEEGLEWAAAQLPEGTPAYLIPHGHSTLPVVGVNGGDGGPAD
jgi:nickel-dependent lactate racemase